MNLNKLRKGVTYVQDTVAPREKVAIPKLKNKATARKCRPKARLNPAGKVLNHGATCLAPKAIGDMTWAHPHDLTVYSFPCLSPGTCSTKDL